MCSVLPWHSSRYSEPLSFHHSDLSLFRHSERSEESQIRLAYGFILWTSSPDAEQEKPLCMLFCVLIVPYVKILIAREFLRRRQSRKFVRTTKGHRSKVCKASLLVDIITRWKRFCKAKATLKTFQSGETGDKSPLPIKCNKKVFPSEKHRRASNAVFWNMQLPTIPRNFLCYNKISLKAFAQQKPL